jgi:hypothetical protein
LPKPPTMGYSNGLLKRKINFMGPLYRELVVYLNRLWFISKEAQKSLEGKQRCPLNGREPIRIAVLKAVKRASTGFVGETSNSLGAYRNKDWRECVSITDLVQQHYEIASESCPFPAGLPSSVVSSVLRVGSRQLSPVRSRSTI